MMFRSVVVPIPIRLPACKFLSISSSVKPKKAGSRLAPRSLRGRIGFVFAIRWPLLRYPSIIRYAPNSFFQFIAASSEKTSLFAIPVSTNGSLLLPLAFARPELTAKSNPSKNLRMSGSTVSGFFTKSA